MIKSFLRQAEQRTAIRAGGVLTGTFTMPVAVYPNNAAKLAFMDRVLPAIAALPQVRSVSTVQVLPLGRNSWSTSVRLEGEVSGPDAPRHQPFWSVVRPGYFATVGLRCVKAVTSRHTTTPAQPGSRS